jgi:hypothetical protein
MTGNLSEELTRLCTIPEPAMFSETWESYAIEGARDRFIQQRPGPPGLLGEELDNLFPVRAFLQEDPLTRS